MPGGRPAAPPEDARTAVTVRVRTDSLTAVDAMRMPNRQDALRTLFALGMTCWQRGLRTPQDLDAALDSLPDPDARPERGRRR